MVFFNKLVREDAIYKNAGLSNIGQPLALGTL